MRYPKLKACVAALAVLWLAGCAVSQGDVNRAYDAANASATIRSARMSRNARAWSAASRL